MINPRHIAQDLRAELHRVPKDVAELMRTAANALDPAPRYIVVTGALDGLTDGPVPAPFPPPLESYELGADAIDDGRVALVGEDGAALEGTP